VQQSFALGDNYQLILDANTQYRASRWLGFDYLAEMKAESVWRSNAQLTLATNADTWSISAYVRNIENDFTPTYQPNSPFRTRPSPRRMP
jgi:iron complex outermembrane receptor protein